MKRLVLIVLFVTCGMLAAEKKPVPAQNTQIALMQIQILQLQEAVDALRAEVTHIHQTDVVSIYKWLQTLYDAVTGNSVPFAQPDGTPEKL